MNREIFFCVVCCTAIAKAAAPIPSTNAVSKIVPALEKASCGSNAVVFGGKNAINFVMRLIPSFMDKNPTDRDYGYVDGSNFRAVRVTYFQDSVEVAACMTFPGQVEVINVEPSEDGNRLTVEYRHIGPGTLSPIGEKLTTLGKATDGMISDIYVRDSITGRSIRVHPGRHVMVLSREGRGWSMESVK